MATQIQPGQWVNVTIKTRPRASAQVKTLVRLFEKDPTVKKERNRLRASRPVREHRRGGRMWADRPPRLPVVQTTPGAKYRVFASLDVLRDLESLGAHVVVAPAK
jgi:hypothetical protein